MDFLDKIKYPAYWKRIRFILYLATIAGIFLVGLVFLATGGTETVYVEQPPSMFGGEPRLVPQEQTRYPAITWLILTAYIAFVFIYVVVDMANYRCMKCESLLWFWGGGGIASFFVRNCPRCGASIEKMHP